MKIWHVNVNYGDEDADDGEGEKPQLSLIGDDRVIFVEHDLKTGCGIIISDFGDEEFYVKRTNRDDDNLLQHLSDIPLISKDIRILEIEI